MRLCQLAIYIQSHRALTAFKFSANRPVENDGTGDDGSCTSSETSESFSWRGATLLILHSSSRSGRQGRSHPAPARPSAHSFPCMPLCAGTFSKRKVRAGLAESSSEIYKIKGRFLTGWPFAVRKPFRRHLGSHCSIPCRPQIRQHRNHRSAVETKTYNHDNMLNQFL
jgi:hypothetical protein